MDGFHTYKREKKPVPNLMPITPYCKNYTRDEEKDLTKPMLEVSDPGKVLLLTESLINMNTLDLEKKLNSYIQQETVSETVFINSNIYVSDEAVVQVVGQQVLALEYRAPLSNLLKNIIKEGEGTVHAISDFDETFQNILNDILDPSENHIFVTVPVFSKFKRGDCFTIPILVTVVNSKKTPDFITKVIRETFRFCLPILANTAKLEEEAKIKTQCQSLLHVARRLFCHIQDLNDLLKEIMVEARKLTNAERCSLFLLDPDHLHLVAKVFDGVVRENVSTEVKIAKDQGIAGHVAATGKLLNIRDAYSHPLFYKGMDEATGFRTRNILCFPIRDENGIIGVAQLCNKNRGNFDFFDEEVALAFSIYCGISIQHSLIYKKMLQATHRSKLSNELMLYHMKVPKEDIVKVLLCTNRHAYLYFDSFNFSPKRIRITETPCQILRMFEDFHLIQMFRIKREVFARFILYVKKGYRDTPYHNWVHAFSVTHFAYSSIKQLKLIEDGYMTHLEAMAYLISCMCHDIDHRGTTNAFQNESGSVFANLYSSEGSVMEHHHLSQSLCILNTDDCNFLEALSYDDYIYFLALMKDNILATDLANHFKLVDKQKQLLEKGYDKSDLDDKYILTCLLMNCADLSDQIKNWDVISVVAEHIYEEFFCQGDLEKAMGKQPQVMMDREEASIPDLQIQFLTGVCLPIFRVLVGIFPDASKLTSNIDRNIGYWNASKNIFTKLSKKGLKPLEILNCEELKNEIEQFIAATTKRGEEEEVFDYDSDSDSDN
ncbi:hypothetical protein RN001_007941 [Aquatica leii]|uniref:Phosphodiesterase n=1 Tax=Aquatica leii TaxID=1421715 RepID=A0AAN7SR58_9COLE|nr:hypothetical protein RN001_007941 [Aquatica leii]